MTEISYVAAQARRWAESDPWQRWIAEAPDAGGRVPMGPELIADYLGANNPFPDGVEVEVLGRDADGWEAAVIVERIGPDEWLVAYAEDGFEGVSRLP